MAYLLTETETRPTLWMKSRTFAVLGIVLLVLASVPFVVNPTTSGQSSAVAFENTKRTGLSGAADRRVEDSSLVVPKAEVYYSQYQYVVGYQGVTSLVAGLQSHERREFGRPLAVYVSDFSGTDVRVGDGGYLRLPGPEQSGWVSARDAYFVVNSSARIPSRNTTVIPFSKRSDANAFVRRYGGEVRRWPATRRLSVGRAARSVSTWERVVNRRQSRTDKAVTKARTALNRPVSTVVGRDASTIAAAINSAPPNTTIVVPPGTYRVDDLRVRKPITIRGAGPNATHITGDENGSVISVSAPQTAVTSLSVSGVGKNRSGADRPVGNISVNKSSWKYQYWKTHGFGDAALVFDTAPRSLVSNVRINTTSNGIISRNSANLTVSNITVYGTKRWGDGFLGVASLGAPVVVQDSRIYGGKVGVYTYAASRSVVRNSSMKGMMVGVFDLYASQLLVSNNTIEDAWNAVYIETRSYGSAVINNRLHNSKNGVLVEGRANYLANNVAMHNKHGMVVQGQYSLYRHNTLARNRVGARGLTLFPTNQVTANDFVSNRQYTTTSAFDILHLWQGNYWSDAPGFDWDDDGRLERAFRPTGAVDGQANRVSDVATLAQSPAVQILRRLQQLMPGLRSAGIVDPRPRATPVRPKVVRQSRLAENGTGRHSDPDPWDFHGT